MTSLLSPDMMDRLVAAARGVMVHACCPYSGFAVGAALLDASGEIHVGVNVESSSSGGTICAERSALATALGRGARSFAAVAVCTNAATPTMPCGICRQLLFDYAPEIVVIADAGGGRRIRTLSELLPDAFGAKDLRSARA